MFIQSHNITGMANLVQTIETINEKYKDLADTIKKRSGGILLFRHSGVDYADYLGMSFSGV